MLIGVASGGGDGRRARETGLSFQSVGTRAQTFDIELWAAQPALRVPGRRSVGLSALRLATALLA